MQTLSLQLVQKPALVESLSTVVISDSLVASDTLPNVAAVGAESIQLLRQQTRRIS